MPYSQTLLDHYQHPRNVGSFPKDTPNVGTALVRSDECGDLIRLQIKVDPSTGLIEEARFKTYGCGPSIASASLGTEWLKGRTLDEALLIRRAAIVSELSLPPDKLHCAALVVEAIAAAVTDARRQME